MAVGFQNRKLWNPAVAEWQKSLNEFPKDPRQDKARHYLGYCLLHGGQLDPAIAELNNVIAKFPQYAELDAVYLNLGVAQLTKAGKTKPGNSETGNSETGNSEPGNK